MISIVTIASDSAIYYLYPRVLPINVRFFSYGTIWAFARIATNIIGASLHTFLHTEYGYWGNFILFYIGAIVYYTLSGKLMNYQEDQS